MKKASRLTGYFVFFTSVAVFTINILIPISQNWTQYTVRYDSKLYETKYNQSQYVIPQSKNPISDEELLSHAGYEYAKGLNPILINSDHPPLGKYLIGWITLITGNNRVSSLIFGFGTIVVISAIIYLLTNSISLVLLVLLMTALDTVFKDQLLHAPILDIIQLFFLVLYLLYFLLFLQLTSKKKFITAVLMGLAAGAMGSTKLYFPALILIGTTGIFLLITERSKIKQNTLYMFTTLTAAVFTYISTYTIYFLEGGTLRSFLGVQKWIFLFWQNNAIDVPKYRGNVYPLILFNRWKVWWGEQQYISFENWSLFWPFFFIVGITIALYTLFLLYKKTLLRESEIHKSLLLKYSTFVSMWILIATLYLYFVPISPRYLMIIFIPIYLLITLSLKRILPKYV